MLELGVIGYGNMGGAMVKGIIGTGLIKPDQIQVSDVNRAYVESGEKELGFHAADNKSVAANSRVLVLAIKPQFYNRVIKEIAAEIGSETIVVSIAPGKTIEDLEHSFQRPLKIVRSMPNAPAMVGAGMTAICGNSLVTQEELQHVQYLMEGFGRAEIVPEYMMDAVVAVSGSAPAYVCLFIEALADAAVKEGMPYPLAYAFVEQAVFGTAKMLLDTKLHPAQLKDTVCSPSGTTIEAVHVLKESGFRSGLISAAEACIQKARQL